jgi:hypothetical protein
MRHHRWVVTVTLLALTSTGVASGQRRPGAAMRFAEMDTNKDGRINRDEWRGTDASLKVHDWNGDGVLSGAEVRMGAWRPARGNPPTDFDSPDVTHVFADWTLAGFHRLDHDGNAAVELPEWHFDRESFHRADHNRDGALNRAEFLGEGDPADDDDREDSFENLDGDRDGRVSRAEWHGGAARFAALDIDRDGLLVRDEATAGPEPMPDLFTSVDLNRDGGIQSSEWHWSRESFDARDANRDGRITREEAAGGAPPAQEVAHRQGYDRGITDGREAGQRDRANGLDFNLDTRPELSTADAGFQGAGVTRFAYQAGYRDGFRRGYREAYSPR